MLQKAACLPLTHNLLTAIFWDTEVDQLTVKRLKWTFYRQGVYNALPELIEMPFGGLTWEGPRNRVFNWAKISRGRGKDLQGKG